MKKYKISVTVLALLLSVGAAFTSMASSKSDDTPCSTLPNAQGTRGTISSLGCSSGLTLCCYKESNNDPVYKP